MQIDIHARLTNTTIIFLCNDTSSIIELFSYQSNMKTATLFIDRTHFLLTLI